MAVQSHNPNLFNHPQQLINRQVMNMNPIEANSNLYNTQMGYYPYQPTTETLLPVYGSFVTDSIQIKSENNSGVTYYNNNNNNNGSRKRTRESISPFSFLGHDISSHLQQQQFDIDRVISQHMEKVRMEVEERRKKQARKIMEVVEGTVMNKLRTKEEEIEKIRKLNWALEERVKSLCIENQIWRDMAQTNEATANALRSNLEHLLATQNVDPYQQQQQQEEQNGVGLLLMDDAQSCCGSNYGEDDDKNEVEGNQIRQLCSNCRKAECSVLLLPCRHLCLCSGCGSSIHICPICKSTKNATLLVNLS
ncbi:hypothetical protein ACFE04_024532 [Oxalis oulophora]